MNQENFDSLFEHYVSGRLTPEEAGQLRAGLQEPEWQHRWRRLSELDGLLADELRSAQPRAAQNRLRQSISSSPRQQRKWVGRRSARQAQRRRPATAVWGAALAAAGLAAAVLVLVGGRRPVFRFCCGGGVGRFARRHHRQARDCGNPRHREHAASGRRPGQGHGGGRWFNRLQRRNPRGPQRRVRTCSPHGKKRQENQFVCGHGGLPCDPTSRRPAAAVRHAPGSSHHYRDRVHAFRLRADYAPGSGPRARELAAAGGCGVRGSRRRPVR